MTTEFALGTGEGSEAVLLSLLAYLAGGKDR